ncbi:MAG TPA: magnesium transporter CorA family protein [Steroidobacteraceae bacterium]|nr:magnesium transporter CorA family protein [Steroidobacteraceae bacterium]
MLHRYALRGQGLVNVSDATLADTVWIDLLEPTPEEERAVEAQCGIDVPTREEMREIESSNRLYEEDGGVYLTATIVTKLDTDLPQNSQVTFILKDGRLITNRYTDPLPFRRYISYAERHGPTCNSGPAVLAGLIEAIINRVADVIERVSADLDAISAEVFTRPTRRRRGGPRDFRAVLERVGQSGELIAKTRESLVSLGRALTFLQQATSVNLSNEVRARFRTHARDVVAMSDHASFLGNNVSFILDATLGMINIDQNNILKIFSVVTVFLLPPSVIGAIYGMNFDHIPWAHESWGFMGALGLMVASAILPYLIFKRRGWL